MSDVKLVLMNPEIDKAVMIIDGEPAAVVETLRLLRVESEWTELAKRLGVEIHQLGADS